MNEHLHHNEPVLSKEFGWSRMEVLLDEHIPVHVMPATRHRPLQILSAAILAVILLCATLHTGDSFLTGTLQKHVLQSGTLLTNVYSTVTSTIPATKQFPHSISTRDFKLNNQTKPLVRAHIFRFEETAPEHLQNSFIQPEKIPATKAEAGRITLLGTLPAVVKTLDVPTRHRAPRFDLAVGFGQHFSINGSNQFAPFPLGEISYHVSKRLNLRLGLEIFAPVHSNAKTLNKTVYVNDPLNNIRLINEITTYQQLNYINIPLSLSLSISKNLFIETGVQASFLVSHKQSMETEAYDSQMNRLPAPPNGPPLIAAASPPPKVPATPANVEYRLLGGVRYTMGKTSFLVNYQQALNLLLGGKTPGNYRNQLLTLKVLYKLK